MDKLGGGQIGVTEAQYRERKFAFGLDLEAVPHAGYTGIHTKMGDLLTIKLKAMNSTMPAESMPTEMTVFLSHDVLLDLRDSGSTVFD